jgi:methylenetetrahydrofolate dehydrogenase (NADP+)/methenyltetrahydrofolate cyclohydrolase
MYNIIVPTSEPMTAKILDGTHVSSHLRSTIAETIAQRLATGARAPCLAVILVGKAHASTLYVNNKRRACQNVGIDSVIHHLAANTTEQTLLTLLQELNTSPDIDGILVQLPLPAHIHSSNIIEHIKPSKDVDGFHPLNIGRLAQGHPQLRPCTPFGIMHLLSHYHLSVSGLSALVVGASNIVGRPMALELLYAAATVTIAHSKTRNLAAHIQQADLIISATGVPNLIDSRWLLPHQIIIDVGIQRDVNNRLCGDIDFETAKHNVAWITPVPGGVGPMTIAMLLNNTVLCWASGLDQLCSSQSKSSSNSPS